MAELETHPLPALQFPELPTETEIYLLPDGRVIVADLPLELLELVETLGSPESCEVAPDSPTSDTPSPP